MNHTYTHTYNHTHTHTTPCCPSPFPPPTPPPTPPHTHRSRFGGIVPHPTGDGEAVVLDLGTKVAPLVQQYVTAMEQKRLREGLKCAIQLCALGNLFFQVRRGGRSVCRGVGVWGGVGSVHDVQPCVNIYTNTHIHTHGSTVLHIDTFSPLHTHMHPHPPTHKHTTSNNRKTNYGVLSRATRLHVVHVWLR